MIGSVRKKADTGLLYNEEFLSGMTGVNAGKLISEDDPFILWFCYLSLVAAAVINCVRALSQAGC